MSDRSLEYLLELKRRRTIRADLNLWAEANEFKPALHHRFINQKLQEVATQTHKRLAIFLPPGSAKSTYGSILFPPYYLAQMPKRNILCCSHNDTLAEKFGRAARNIVEAQQLILGYSLKRDSKAAGEWETSNNGRYFCAGVGARIAGHRADLAIIDDPTGKKQDVDQLSNRDTAWDWYNWDFKPRLKPGANVILIQTRWHDDDLAGRILNKENDWEVISIPLIAEKNDPLGRVEGEALWPEYFDAQIIAEAKASPGFTQLYQQRPAPESGDYFERSWIREYDSEDKLPKNLRYYMGGDFACSVKEENDETCLPVAGVDSSDTIWILPELFWGHYETDQTVDAILRLCRIYRPDFFWAGREHITASIGPFLRRREFEEKVFVPLEETSSARDKRSRAQPLRGMFKRGQIMLPSFAPWYAKALEQLMRFDKGVHDDFVDALAEIGRGLDKVIGHYSPAPVNEILTPPRITMRWVKEQMARTEFAQQMERLDR